MEYINFLDLVNLSLRQSPTAVKNTSGVEMATRLSYQRNDYPFVAEVTAEYFSAFFRRFELLTSFALVNKWNFPYILFHDSSCL